MRTFVSMLILLVLCTSLNAQSLAIADTNSIDANGMRQGYWRITAALKNDARYSPETVLEEGNYLNDQRTGVWIGYYSGGNIKSRVTYSQDRPNGWSETYYENGNFMEQGNWVGNKWTGPYARYYENGKKQQNFTYSADGKREGQQFYYFESGILMIEVFMKNGKEDGIKREYNCKGVLARLSQWKEGQIIPDRTEVFAPLTCETNREPEIKPNDTLRQRPPAPPRTPCEGYNSLYQDQLLVKRGLFDKNCRLIDGEERVYNNSGELIQIKAYKGGRYIGDLPLPE